MVLAEVSWVPFAQTLLGGILTLLGGLLGTYYAGWVRRRHDRQSLAGAFAGEIATIVNLAERRGYVRHLETLINTSCPPGVVPIYYFTVRHNYFRVYETNADKLGLLPPELAEDVARFYGLCYAFLEDVADLKEGQQDAAVLSTAHERLVQMRAFLTEALDLGRRCHASAANIAHSGRASLKAPSNS